MELAFCLQHLQCLSHAVLHHARAVFKKKLALDTPINTAGSCFGGSSGFVLSSETISGLYVANRFNVTPNVSSCSEARRSRGNHVPPGHCFENPATQFTWVWGLLWQTSYKTHLQCAARHWEDNSELWLSRLWSEYPVQHNVSTRPSSVPEELWLH